MSDIESRLQSIFRRVLHDENLVLTRELTASDVEGWDSLSHVQIMMRSEKEFAVKFKASEIGKMKNVGMLVDLIQTKIGNA